MLQVTSVTYFAALSCCLLGVSAPCQRTLHISYGGAATDNLGGDVRSAGDVNADGVPDLIAGALGEYALVISGKDGSVIHKIVSQTQNFAETVAGGLDFNNDGHSDLLIGRQIAVYSGKDGTLLASNFPTAGTPEDLCVLSDVDLDGYRDFAYVRRGNPGHIEIHSGKTGASIRSIPFGKPGDMTLRVVGDIDADGIDDVIVTSKHDMSVFSPVTGLLLHSATATFPTKVWEFVSGNGVGDVDGDGWPDFATGTPQEPDPVTGFNSGVVHVYSGQSRALLMEIRGPSGVFSRFGATVCAAGDLNQDGYGDIAIGADDTLGSMYVYSGATGTMMMSVEGVNGSFGRAMDAAGDLNGDGFMDIAVGAPNHGWSKNGQGMVQVISGEILAATWMMGTGCGGGPFLPILASTRPILGQQVTFYGQGVPPSSSGGVVIVSRAATPAVNLGVPGCDLFLDLAAAIPLFVVPAQDWSTPLSLPATPGFTGLDIVFQSFYFGTSGPLGFDLSNGLRWRVGFQ